MKQVSKDDIAQQVFYMGRWVDKKHFRVFVYKSDGTERLVNSYDEFMELISSGVWDEKMPTSELPISTELVEEKEEKKDVNSSFGKVEPKFRVKDVKKPVQLNEFKSNRSGGKQL